MFGLAKKYTDNIMRGDLFGVRGVRLTSVNGERWPGAGANVWQECFKNIILIRSPVKAAPSAATVLYSDSVCVARSLCLALICILFVFGLIYFWLLLFLKK